MAGTAPVTPSWATVAVQRDALLAGLFSCAAFVHTLVPGYVDGDRLLRPADVVVDERVRPSSV
jgi:hypothetical protein